MSVVTALVAGGVIGVRHALEADHLAAVATLVEEGNRRTGTVGVSWGIGHSIPIAVFGLAFVILDVSLPEPVTGVFEVLVGLVLVFLGGRTLGSVLGVVDVASHSHGDGDRHSHFRIGPFSIGTHQHVDGDSFLVGVIHGFAGSGALVVALVAVAPTFGAALAFLGAFSVLSILTMAVVAVLWERTLETGLGDYLEGAAGVASVAVGLVLLGEQLLGGAIF